MWAFLRAIDEEEPHPRLWAFIFAASLGTGLLLKSLIAVVFPVGAAIVYLFLTGQLFNAKTWKRLHPFSGVVVASADRGAVAHSGDDAQSTLFCVDAAQRAR